MGRETVGAGARDGESRLKDVSVLVFVFVFVFVLVLVLVLGLVGREAGSGACIRVEGETFGDGRLAILCFSRCFIDDGGRRGRSGLVDQ